MDLNTQLAIIKLRDLMKEYIETKVTVLANDIIPVLTTLDQLSKEKDIDSLYNDYNQQYINNTCIFPSNDVPFIDIYKVDYWWKQNDTILKKRSYGNWWDGKSVYNYNQLSTENKKNLKILCIMNKLIFDTLFKNKNWDKWINVTVMDYFITFSNGFHINYPAKYASYKHISDSTFLDKLRDPNCTNIPITEYYPKCRPYFIQATKEQARFIITPPYEWADSTFGSTICGKTIDKDSRYNNIQKIIMCIDFTFGEFKSLSYVNLDILKNNLINILYDEGNILSVFYSSKETLSNYSSYGEFLNVTSYNENNYFEVKYRTLFDLVYNDKFLGVTDPLLINERKNEFRQIYKNISSYYTNNIYSSIKLMIQNINTYGDDITINNYIGNEKQFSFNITQNFIFNPETKVVELAYVNEEYYVLPIKIGLDYDDNYNIRITNTSNFYFIYKVEEEISRIQLLFNIIAYDLCLYFVFSVGLSLLIYGVFYSLMHYFFKGFLYPLKKIDSILKQLILQEVY